MNDSKVPFVMAFGPALEEFDDPITALVFGAVWFKSNQGAGVCNAAPATIGEIVKVNAKTVRRRLADLVEGGYLEDLTPPEKQRSKVHDYIVTPAGLALTECQKSDIVTETDKIKDTQSLHADSEPANSGQTVPNDRHNTGHKVPSRSQNGVNGPEVPNKGQRVQQKEYDTDLLIESNKPLEGESEKVESPLNGADAPPPPIPEATFPADVFPDPGEYTIKQIEGWVLRKSQWVETLKREKAGKNRTGVKRHITQRLEKKAKAVEAYREEAQAYPEKTTWEMIDKAVGDDPENLNFWRQVVKYYIAHGWNKTNVAGMIDFYNRREIPGQSDTKGKVINGTRDFTNGRNHSRQSETDRNRALNRSDEMDIYLDIASGQYIRHSTGEIVVGYGS